MNKNNRGAEPPPARTHHYRLSQKTELAFEHDFDGTEDVKYCVACLLAGRTTTAVGHTSHPEYRSLPLCAECIARYDGGMTQ